MRLNKKQRCMDLVIRENILRLKAELQDLSNLRQFSEYRGFPLKRTSFILLCHPAFLLQIGVEFIGTFFSDTGQIGISRKYILFTRE